MRQFYALTTHLLKQLPGLLLGTLLTAGAAHAQSGNALDLDGANDYVSLPASLTSGVTNFTFEAWLNYQDTRIWTRVLDFGTGTTVNMFLTPRNGDNNAPRFAITTGGGGGAEQRLSSTTELSAGQHHLAVTLSQNGSVVTGTLYVDGAVAATNPNMTLTPNSLGTLNQLYLGRSQYAADPYLKGDLDEVRFYNTALTQAQVQADMKNGAGTSAVPASLLAYYNFNQGTANGDNPSQTSLLDRSGNARNGTLINFALTGTSSNWVGGTAPLPVTLVRFAAQRQGEVGQLTWTTASELNNAYFEVECSLDGVAFRTLSRVAGHGTSTQTQSYQFTDDNLARYATQVLYYRLRQVDVDGTATYSPVRTISLPAATTAALLDLYPNPATGSDAAITLNLFSFPQGSYQAALLSLTGATLATCGVAGGQAQALALPTALPAGTYVLRVEGNGLQVARRLTKQP